MAMQPLREAYTNPKNLRHFKELQFFAHNKDAKHDSRLMQKVSSQEFVQKTTPSQWYSKEITFINFPEDCLREVIFAEFARLIAPDFSTKTRAAYSTIGEITGEKQNWHVLSKEIPNAFALQKEHLDLVNTEQLSGLAALSLITLFLNDIDFRPANVLVTKGRMYRIDLGCAGWHNFFSQSQLDSKFKNSTYFNFNIIAEDLAYLPHIKFYTGYNWLFQYRHDKENPYYDLMEYETLAEKPSFKRELHKILLKLTILPSELIEQFPQQYLPQEDLIEQSHRQNITELFSYISKILMFRQSQLRSAALQLPEFCKYLNSENCQTDLHKIINEITSFTTMRKHLLVSENQRQIITTNLTENARYLIEQSNLKSQKINVIIYQANLSYEHHYLSLPITNLDAILITLNEDTTIRQLKAEIVKQLFAVYMISNKETQDLLSIHFGVTAYSYQKLSIEQIKEAKEIAKNLLLGNPDSKQNLQKRQLLSALFPKKTLPAPSISGTTVKLLLFSLPTYAIQCDDQKEDKDLRQTSQSPAA